LVLLSRIFVARSCPVTCWLVTDSISTCLASCWPSTELAYLITTCVVFFTNPGMGTMLCYSSSLTRVITGMTLSSYLDTPPPSRSPQPPYHHIPGNLTVPVSAGHYKTLLWSTSTSALSTSINNITLLPATRNFSFQVIRVFLWRSRIISSLWLHHVHTCSHGYRIIISDIPCLYKTTISKFPGPSTIPLPW
jgi:hypothetical protein